MELNGVEIEDTYCEAFGAFFTRILITAKNEKWIKIAAQEISGYGTSGIGCDAEVGIDLMVPADNTPDKRLGVAVMLFIKDKKKVSDVMLHRVGQCVLTCSTTACFDAIDGSLEPEKEFDVKTGFFLKYFGDKYEEKLEGVYPFPTWKIPIMAGEFIVQSVFKAGKGVAGGNFLIIGKNLDSTLEAAEKAIEAINGVKNVIAPFPGGIVPSGSKVGTQYNIPSLFATTNHKYCPTLRTKVEDTNLKEGDGCVLEIVFDGATEEAVKEAMKLGIQAAVKVPGINRISAGNYGGKLGKFLYKLHELGL